MVGLAVVDFPTVWSTGTFPTFLSNAITARDVLHQRKKIAEYDILEHLEDTIVARALLAIHLHAWMAVVVVVVEDDYY
jgi:hypothetical protein